MKRIQLSIAVLLPLFAALELILVHGACNGHFIYSLDDPYIHLAVASNLLKGTYGVNLSEASSPCSSVLWAWVLALALRLGLGTFGPLLIDISASVMSALLVGRIVGKLFPGTENIGFGKAVLVAVAIIFALSAVALPFTGLEHSLHILVVVAVCGGLIDVAQGRNFPIYACIALAVMPLVRFEGFALAGAAIVALLFTRERVRALVAFAGLTAGVTAYVAFVVRNHLPIIPTSVALKSNVFSGSGLVGTIEHVVFGNLFGHMISEETAFLLNIAFLACILFLVVRGDRKKHFVVLGPISLAVLAQIMAGPYGWFGRYEVYALVIGAIGVLYVVSKIDWQCVHPIVRHSFAVLILLQLDLPYLATTLQTARASGSIYRQQYQMAEFAKDFYKRPVGVNDLGLVSYQNPSYVLDLYGLDSEEVRKLKKEGRYTPDRIDELAARHNVGLIMVYPNWFDALPKDWTEIATLRTPKGGAVESARVVFYATPDGDPTFIASQLRAFAPQLPNGDSVQFAAGQ